MSIEGERTVAEGILADLLRWERYFDSEGTSDDGLVAHETSQVQIGFSRTGILSTRFACRFEIGRLTVDCENEIRALEFEGEDGGCQDALATVRMAILLLRAELDGRAWLPNDPQATVRVESDETGVSFDVRNAAGEVCASEEGWDGLLRILDRLPENGESQIWA